MITINPILRQTCVNLGINGKGKLYERDNCLKYNSIANNWGSEDLPQPSDILINSSNEL